jgi:hypothetical protein
MQNGQTLAQIALAQGKTVDGLISALVTAAESNLSGMVSLGKISSSQEAAIESSLQTQTTAMVHGTTPAGGFGGGRRGGVGFGSPGTAAATGLATTTAEASTA